LHPSAHAPLAPQIFHAPMAHTLSTLPVPPPTAAPSGMPAPLDASVSAPAASRTGPSPASAGTGNGAAAAAEDDAKFLYASSPFVGTFYSAPSPEAPSFVEIGQRVKKGQVLCIVEAMKLMNEIEAEIEGTVVAVLVENAQPVEYGQHLF